jgi:plasmid maintenance system antidote protein VapI
MGGSMGKDFPICQGTLSPSEGEQLVMAQKNPTPGDILAHNLRHLLKATDMTGPEVARKAGVDRKTVNNQINGRFDSQSISVERVAQVFGLHAADLLDPDFDVTRSRNDAVRDLVRMYEEADETGRHAILTVAKMATKAE